MEAWLHSRGGETVMNKIILTLIIKLTKLMAITKLQKLIHVLFVLMFTSRVFPEFSQRGFVSCVRAQADVKNT